MNKQHSNANQLSTVVLLSPWRVAWKIRVMCRKFISALCDTMQQWVMDRWCNLFLKSYTICWPLSTSTANSQIYARITYVCWPSVRMLKHISIICLCFTYISDYTGRTTPITTTTTAAPMNSPTPPTNTPSRTNDSTSGIPPSSISEPGFLQYLCLTYRCLDFTLNSQRFFRIFLKAAVRLYCFHLTLQNVLCAPILDICSWWS